MICKKCKKDLPITDFYMDYTRNRPICYCKVCKREVEKENRLKRKEVKEVKELTLPQFANKKVLEICSMFNITRKQMFTNTRKKNIVYARKVLCLFLRDRGLSYQKIGDMLKIDHTTAISINKDRKKVEDYLNEFIFPKKIKRVNYKTGEVTYD